MQPDSRIETQPTLDPEKLFGFRNLVQVTPREGDIRDSADLAFQKRGTEAPA